MLNFNKDNWLKLEQILIPLALFSALGISIYFYLGEQKKIDDKLLEKSGHNGPKTEDLMKDGKTILWAGLSGEYPKFISKGPFRGIGYLEYGTYKIRNLLTQEYGIRILKTYMTPARLTFDMLNGKFPICHYPYIWKNPEKEFAQPVKFLYSKGLDFGGEKEYKIIYLKKYHSLFVKHYNNDGFINMESLFKDNKLKTELLRDVNYGDVVNKIMYRDKDNNAQIRDEYKKHIKLMVATNNRQFVQMLKGDRFHYTFSEIITPNHFKMAKINPDEYMQATYEKTSISSVKDPNMEIYSVRCNKHPLSYKLMPIINDLIEKMRSAAHTISVMKMQQKLEQADQKNTYSQSILLARFRQELVSKDIDYWYEKYLHNLNENFKKEISHWVTTNNKMKDFIPVSKENNNLTTNQLTKASRVNKLVAVYKNNILFILRKNNILQTPHHFNSNIYEQKQRPHLMDPSDIPYQLSEDEIEILHDIKINNDKYNALEEYTPQEIVQSIIEKSQNEWKNIKKIILNGFALEENVAYEIISTGINSSKKIEGIKTYFLDKNDAQKVIKILPKSLIELSLVSTNLLKENILPNLLNLKLKNIDFSQSEIHGNELIKLLINNKNSLKELDLSYQNSLFNQEFIKKFNQINFSQLEKLRLFRSIMYLKKKDNQSLFKNIPPSIKTIDISNSSFPHDDVDIIFQRAPHLINFYAGYMLTNPGDHPEDYIRPGGIDLSNNKIEKNNYFPSNLKVLSMPYVKINGKVLAKMNLPQGLTHLNLEGNPLGDDGLRILAHKLKNIKLTSLRLGNSLSSSLAMSDFVHNAHLKDLKELSLFEMSLDSKNLNTIIKDNHSLELLDIRDNLISDLSIPIFSKLKGLKILDIGGNFITSHGFYKLVELWKKHKINPTSLSMNEILGIQGVDFFKKLPHTLNDVSIQNNLFTSSQMKMFFSYLPTHLTNLFITGNNIDKKSLYIFLKNCPTNLSKIRISLKNDDVKLLKSFIESLPNNLELFDLSKDEWKESLKLQDSSFPKNLHRLNFSVKSSEDALINLIETLPEYLLTTGIQNLSEKSLKMLSSKINKKKVIRVILLSGLASQHPYTNEFIKSLPSSISLIALIGGFPPHFVDAVFEEKLKGNLTNLGYFMIVSVKHSAENKKSLNFCKNSMDKSIMLFNLGISGSAFDDQSLAHLSKCDLSSVYKANFIGTELTEDKLVTLLKRMPHLRILNMNSFRLNKDRVDDVIKNLPENLSALRLNGIPFGTLGLEKFREWKKRQEEKLQTSVVLEE